METQILHPQPEQLLKRIKYLEGLLEKNNIQYSKNIGYVDSIVEPLNNKLDLICNNSNNNQPIQPKPITEKIIVDRYGRQMLVPNFGRLGQQKLQNSRVLIIGVGGIGAPAAYYLAAAGIGKLGLVDGDKVEESNLHRQIIHSTNKVAINKAISAKMALQQLNPYINIETFETHITSQNAGNLVENYDIVLDATDNALSRYLINDICLIKKKILISGSALRWEGQLTIFGYGDGPCYRCLYDKCPSPNMMLSCSDGGVIGLIPGIIGMLEAVEAIKIITNQGEIFNKKMLIYDGLNNTFRISKIRGCQPNCILCGKNPTLVDVSNYDYDNFIGWKACSIATTIPSIPQDKNIKWIDFMQIYKENDFNNLRMLIDVRPKELYDVVKLNGAINIPLGDLTQFTIDELYQNIPQNKPIYLMCKRGIASKRALDHLLKNGYKNVYNIEGGFTSYCSEIDPNMPLI